MPSASHLPVGAATTTTNNNSLCFYAGLTLAGTASAVLTCLISLLHLQVFLNAYHLPLHVYSVGSSLFAVINTANDVGGAYLVDCLASIGGGGRQKHEYVGFSGCLFALCFLTPFFRISSDNNSASTSIWGGGLHFVTSMSLYDTMYSFHCILLSSIITDHSSMSDKSRIAFLAVGKVTNLLAPMMVARIALGRLDIHNLQPLRNFLVVVAIFVCGVSLVAQRLLLPSNSNATFLGCIHGRQSLPKAKVDSFLDDDNYTSKVQDIPLLGTMQQKKKTRGPQLRQVVKDFLKHRNFKYWICMELLLEGQTTFLKSFLKTFVDHLLLEQQEGYNNEGGLSRSTCEWFLSSHDALVAITSLILLYFPIQRHGYAKVYSWVFRINLGVSTSLIAWFCCRPKNEGLLVLEPYQHLDYTGPIFSFLLFYTTILQAVGSAGFALAMSDMVLEMKHVQANQGRWDEPSLAGLFMGVNALFCKPAESVLPILTATLLGKTDFHGSPSSTTMTTTETVLLRLLLIPPFVCSILQLWAWSHYDLTPKKTLRLRTDWKSMMSTRNDPNVVEKG